MLSSECQIPGGKDNSVAKKLQEERYAINYLTKVLSTVSLSALLNYEEVPIEQN